MTDNSSKTFNNSIYKLYSCLTIALQMMLTQFDRLGFLGYNRYMCIVDALPFAPSYAKYAFWQIKVIFHLSQFMNFIE